MTKAMWRYYVINSLLGTGKLPKVPDEVKDVLDGLENAQVEEMLSEFPPLKLTELEMTFLNYLRTPDYPICVASGSGHLLSLAVIASRVREDGADITVENTRSWASASILDVVYADSLMPEVRESVLILPMKYRNGKENLVEAMERAYAYYCWGMENPTPAQKKLVQWCVEFSNPSQSMQFKAGSVEKFLGMCVDAQVYPANLSQTVLYIHSLSETLPAARVPCWWAGFDHKMVSVILPQGKGDWVAHARLTFESFRELASSMSGLSSLYVKGGRIMLGDAT